MADFLKNNVILTLSLLIANILNFLIYLFASRYFSVSDFSALISLISIFYIFSIFFSSLRTATTKVFSQARENFVADRFIFGNLLKNYIKLGGVVFLTFIFISVYLKSILEIPSFGSFVILGISIFFIFPYSLTAGSLSGNFNFTRLSIALVSESLVKFIVSIFLLQLGWGLEGVMAGILAGTLVGILLSLPDKKILSESFSKNEGYPLFFLIFTTLSLLVITLLYTLDILFARTFLDHSQSGLFAGVSTISKIILFGSMGIWAVLFPSINKNAGNLLKQKKYFNLAIKIVSTLIVFSILAFLLFGNEITQLSLGSNFIVVSELLPIFGVSMSLLTMSVLFVYFFMAMEKYIVFIFLAASLFIQIALLSIFHSSIQEILAVDMISYSTLLFFLISYYLFAIKIKKNSVLLFGAYGKRNLGDEILLDLMVKNLQSGSFNVAASGHDTTYLAARYPEVRFIRTRFYKDLLSLVNNFIQAGNIVYGGGTLILESHSKLKIEPLMKLMAINLLGKLVGAKILLLGVGVGKLNSWISKKMTSISLNLADVIVVRDEESADILKNLDIKKPIFLTADLSFTLARASANKKNGFPRRIGVSLTRDLLKDIDYISEEFNNLLKNHLNLTLVLFPLQEEDTYILKKLKSLLIYKKSVELEPLVKIGEESRFRKLDLMIGSRYHSLLLATLQGVPTIGISSNDKVFYLMRQIKRESFTWHTELRKPIDLSSLIAEATSIGIDQQNLENLNLRAQQNFKIMGKFLEKRTFNEDNI